MVMPAPVRPRRRRPSGRPELRASAASLPKTSATIQPHWHRRRPRRNKAISRRSPASKQTQSRVWNKPNLASEHRPCAPKQGQSRLETTPGRVRCADHSMDKTEGPHSGPYPAGLDNAHDETKPFPAPDPASKQSHFVPERGIETKPILTVRNPLGRSSKPFRFRYLRRMKSGRPGFNATAEGARRGIPGRWTTGVSGSTVIPASPVAVQLGPRDRYRDSKGPGPFP